MNNISNTTIKRDNPRLKEMQDFLNFVYQLMLQNPGYITSYNQIYYLLCNYSLKPGDVDSQNQGLNVNEYMEHWSRHFRNKRNIHAFYDSNYPSWYRFENGDLKKEERFIKIYVPLDKKHLYRGVKEIFEFLENKNIEHSSKVGKIIRADNIVIRLREKDEHFAYELINFITNNQYIQEGLNKNNPFVPSINGIGFQHESGISYNSEISKLIISYLSQCKDNGLSRIDLNDFTQWLINNYYSLEVYQIFNEAITGKSTYDKEKAINNDQNLTAEQKRNLFLDALKATYLKYGIKHCKEAIRNILYKNNYDMITNGTSSYKYRDNLKKYLRPKEIENIVIRFPVTDSKGLDINIDTFCKHMFLSDQIHIFDEICTLTIENHDANFLVDAIYSYYTTGYVNGFSRFDKHDKDRKVNYRDRISRINKENVIGLIKKSLHIRGIDAYELRDIEVINLYAQSLAKGMYVNFDQTPKFSR